MEGRKGKQEWAEAEMNGGTSLRFTITASGQMFPNLCPLPATTLLPTKKQQSRAQANT